MIKYFFYGIITICIFSFSLLKAQTEADELLKNIQEKFDTVKDMSADLRQSVNGNVNLNGKIFFKKEDKLRFEFDNVLIISDGETSWNYNKKENKVIIVENDDETNYLSINKIIYEYPGKCDLSSDEVDGRTVLILTPETSELNFSTAKLFINNDNLISRAIIDDPAGRQIQLDFSNYKINQNLSDSYFSFIPPEGSNIIDLR
jgi:outer membrane lipoprotein carrier protein